MLRRLARWCFDNPWKVMATWVAILAGLFGTLRAIGPDYDNGFDILDSDSSAGFELLNEYFPGLSSVMSGTIVFETDQGVTDPVVQAKMTELFAAMGERTGPGDDLENMVIFSPYDEGGENQISPQGPKAGHVAYARVVLPCETDQRKAQAMGPKIAELIQDIGLDQVDGLTVEIGGAQLAEFSPPESELLGIAFAIAVLILAMGSVMAMGTTIGVAVVGVGGGAAVIGLLSNLISMPDFGTTIGVMIGLGVGIDYALFIVTRYRESLAQGRTPSESIETALDTAGRSVIFAGATVIVSLLGMLLMGLAFVSGMGIGASSTVTVVMAAAITLLPAALGLVKERVNNTRVGGMIAAGLVALALLGAGLGIKPLLLALPAALVVAIVSRLPFAGPLGRDLPPRAPTPVRETIWYRWSRLVQSRPWAWVGVSVGLLGLLAVPLFSLNLGFSDEGNFPADSTTRRAYDLLAEGFGPGANGPMIAVAELTGPADMETLGALAAAANTTEGVAFAAPPFPNDPTEPTAAIVMIQPTTSPQDAATSDLVEVLRDEVIPRTVAGTNLEPHLTGPTAANIDFTDYLAKRTPIFFAVVLGLSFLLLMTVFRSLMVPLKAVIMNMLSIGAAYGVVVAIFQWGWGASLFNVSKGPVEPFIPMMMFAIVFGLSMDYEVFILSRMKEEFSRTGDPVASVADGLAMTARVITAAAAIMVVVFGSFLFEDQRVIKLFGVGLATAVFIDASIVRMLLVPATMQLLGARNWWIPAWLDRILPDLNIEGTIELEPDHDPDHLSQALDA